MTDRYSNVAGGVVTVEFTDGGVRDYLINATLGISAKLAETTGRNRILTIWNDDETFNIPLSQIKSYTLRNREVQPAPEGEVVEPAIPDGSETEGLARFMDVGTREVWR